MFIFKLNTIPYNVNLGHKVLGRNALMCANHTLSAVLVFSGTVIRHDVNKQIKASACLLPFDDVGRSPMQSMAQLVNCA